MDADFLKSLQSAQQREQIESSMREMAAIVAEYNRQLRAQGLNAIEALALTTNYQQTMLHHVLPAKEGE